MGDHYELPQPHVGARRLQRVVLTRIEWQGRPTSEDADRSARVVARMRTFVMRENEFKVASIAVFGYWRFYHVRTVRPPALGTWRFAGVSEPGGPIGAIPRFRTAQDPIRRTADR